MTVYVLYWGNWLCAIFDSREAIEAYIKAYPPEMSNNPETGYAISEIEVLSIKDVAEHQGQHPLDNRGKGMI